MIKTININGVNFEVLKPFKLGNEKIVYYNNKTLKNCYNKPSKTKEDIYNSWLIWYRELENDKDVTICLDSFGIHSYNTWMFTLTFPIMIKDNIYHCYITPNHNYIERILL